MKYVNPQINPTNIEILDKLFRLALDSDIGVDTTNDRAHYRKALRTALITKTIESFLKEPFALAYFQEIFVYIDNPNTPVRKASEHIKDQIYKFLDDGDVIRKLQPYNNMTKYPLYSIFFGYLLVTGADNKKIRECISYCLENLGIRCDETELEALSDLKVIYDENGYFEEGALTTFIKLLCEVGRRDKQKPVRIEALKKCLEDCLRDINRKQSLIDNTQKYIYNNIKSFIPRSISNVSDARIHNIFVKTGFRLGENNADAPLKGIGTNGQIFRGTLTGTTGMGKSIYSQMSTSCLLRRYEDNEKIREELDRFSAAEELPEDMLVISIPARMFSKAYNSDIRKSWVSDNSSLEQLFFNFIWNPISGFNPYTSENLDGTGSNRFIEDDNMTLLCEDTIYDFVRQELLKKAKKGKLLLILDGFDEIVVGDMRDRYLRLVNKFRETYDNGAHIFLITRPLSDAAQKAVSGSIDSHSDYSINPLDTEKKKELLDNWINNRILPDASSREYIVDKITNNKYYKEYSDNPYMFSILCLGPNSGKSILKISEDLFNFLYNRLDSSLKTFKPENPAEKVLLYNVLNRLKTSVMRVAYESVVRECPAISLYDITLSEEDGGLDDTDKLKSDNELNRIFRNILTTQAGLIVPANNEDNLYQFINDQLRYYLAARYVKENYADHPELMNDVKDFDRYSDFFVPLFCQFGRRSEDYRVTLPLTEAFIVSDLKPEKKAEIAYDLITAQYYNTILNLSEYDRFVLPKATLIGSTMLKAVLADESLTDREINEIKASPLFKNFHINPKFI